MHRFWTNRGSSTEFSQMCFVKKYHLLQIFTRNMQADPHSIPSIWRAKIRRGKGYRFYQPDILQLNGENSGIICSYFSLLTYPNLAVLKDVSYKTRSVSYNYQQSFRTKKDVSYNLYETSWSHSYKKKVGTKRLFLYETDLYETSLLRNVQELSQSTVQNFENAIIRKIDTKNFSPGYVGSN